MLPRGFSAERRRRPKMKFLSGKNGALFVLLLAGLVFNILWSMRLESKAEKVGSIVNAYHLQLEALQDVLPQIEQFSRFCKGPMGLNLIKLDEKGLAATVGPYTMAMDGKSVEISHPGGTKIELDDESVRIHADKLLVDAAPIGKHMKFYMTPDPIVGLWLSHRSGGNLWFSQKGVMLRASKGKELRIGDEEFDAFQIAGGPDGMQITAKGDIDIRSTDGNVKINGKEIHLNQ
jgi:hypothetical protein